MPVDPNSAPDAPARSSERSRSRSDANESARGRERRSVVSRRFEHRFSTGPQLPVRSTTPPLEVYTELFPKRAPESEGRGSSLDSRNRGRNTFPLRKLRRSVVPSWCIDRERCARDERYVSLFSRSRSRDRSFTRPDSSDSMVIASNVPEARKVFLETATRESATKFAVGPDIR